MDPVIRIKLRAWGLVGLVVGSALILLLGFAIIVLGSTSVPRPKDPPEEHFYGAQFLNCDGVFLQKRGYGPPQADTLYMVTFVYKEQLVLWYIDEPPYGDAFDYVVVALLGERYERMSFEEVRERFPTVCDVPLVKGGSS